MFKLRDKKEENVFEFSKIFKEFWSEHSHSMVIPSYLLLRRNNSFSAIILFKDNSIIENIIRVLRNGAAIDSFALCVDGDVTKNSVGSVLSVADIKSNSIVLKLFSYNIEEDFNVEWLGEMDIVECNQFYKYQSILHQESNLNDIKEIVSRLGFDEERQYFHNLRFVFSFLEKNENLYIIDLISPSHPEWVDASEKFIKLLNDLEKRKIISINCRQELENAKDYIGKSSFIHEVEQIIRKNWQMCDVNELVSPEIFTEILHRKIFDYKFDLHNYNSICW